jgi:hypothetical protein
VEKKTKKPGIFWKILLVIIMAHGMTCVTLSYILAWTGHEQTVEMVSQTLVTEILAPFVAGILSKTIENIFEKNKLSFSEPIKDLEKIRETEYADDISEIGGGND